MKRIDLFFTAALVPLDYLTLILAAIAAFSLRFIPMFTNIRPVTFDLTLAGYLQTIVPLAIVWIVIFALSGLYAIKTRRLATEATRIIVAVSAGIAVVLGIAFFSRELFESRFILLAIWAVASLFLIIERLTIRMIQRTLYSKGIGAKYVVILGKTKSGHELREFFTRFPRLGFHVSQQFGSFSEETKQRILELRKKNKADILCLADPHINHEQLEDIKSFADIEHLTFLYSAELFPGSAVQPIIHTFAGIPVIEIPKTPLDGWGAIYKRLFDIVVSFFLIVFSLPIQVIVAAALLIERQGGILFHQKRMGQNEKPFQYFKFRSMVKNAVALRSDPAFIKKFGNERKGPLFKLKDDPRVTPVGRILRKLSLDEIPEFYLVFFGRMSIIGPRPHLPEEVANYKPAQRRVLTIKPGITGIAQISGRANLDFNDEVRLDMYYIENWSPWMDLVVLVKTPLAVFFRTGAY
ncbi:MAG: sugar transferase [Patescibacteria group bacterium]|jgi:exopolysaccharide biosynthesis polyprenyl glycosylphosphotransferase